jgi:hypothetical protein
MRHVVPPHRLNLPAELLRSGGVAELVVSTSHALCEREFAVKLAGANQSSTSPGNRRWAESDATKKRRDFPLCLISSSVSEAALASRSAIGMWSHVGKSLCSCLTSKALRRLACASSAGVPGQHRPSSGGHNNGARVAFAGWGMGRIHSKLGKRYRGVCHGLHGNP